ncbi:MAG: hypothetical protein HUK17_02960 [Bacteroidales bacterium]|nr:hypothetical protein [Bacteroidales bacterium]
MNILSTKAAEERETDFQTKATGISRSLSDNSSVATQEILTPSGEIGSLGNPSRVFFNHELHESNEWRLLLLSRICEFVNGAYRVGQCADRFSNSQILDKHLVNESCRRTRNC